MCVAAASAVTAACDLPAGEEAAVVDRERFDCRPMAGQNMQRLTRWQLPHVYRRVVAAREQPVAVVIDGNGEDAARVGTDIAVRAVVVRPPDFDLAVVASGEQQRLRTMTKQ